MKKTIALAMAAAALAAYGQLHHPKNPLPVNGHLLQVQCCPPPVCPGHPGCPPKKETKKENSNSDPLG